MERVRTHVCGVHHFLDLFPSLAKAYQTTAKLRKRGIIKYIGSAQITGDGRPRDMFYNGKRPEMDQLIHEYHLTTFCLLYPDAEFKRLHDVDPRYRADAEMLFLEINKKYFVELHTGTVRNHQRIQERFRAYESSCDDVLWVCLQPDDKQKLMQLCDYSNMYFTCLEDVLKQPFGSVWTDRDGHLCELE
ncbi:hypothetical protein Pan241w_53190 [Gimesia alba]|uniref:Uncharacterized protein n=1 Tax=Gimesia alba TaxID=2527973 RepID=A0A517RMU2_9PLAN|nr:hypothetical protein [Gimesia alba]QDT45200.1 hypothetical protein Pan241w_53190 [Gimesia alba]